MSHTDRILCLGGPLDGEVFTVGDPWPQIIEVPRAAPLPVIPVAKDQEVEEWTSTREALVARGRLLAVYQVPVDPEEEELLEALWARFQELTPGVCVTVEQSSRFYRDQYRLELYRDHRLGTVSWRYVYRGQLGENHGENVGTGAPK